MAKLGREARKRRGRAPKDKTVTELTNLFKKSQGVVFGDNRGLTVADATKLRNTLRAGNVRLKVAKNSLVDLSMRRAGLDTSALSKVLTGPTMVAFGIADPVTPAKLLTKFASDNEKLGIKGGFLDGKALSLADITALSKMPGREQLLANMLGSLQAPARNLVCTLNSAVSKLVWALQAVKTQMEKA